MMKKNIYHEIKDCYFNDELIAFQQGFVRQSEDIVLFMMGTPPEGDNTKVGDVITSKTINMDFNIIIAYDDLSAKTWDADIHLKDGYVIKGTADFTYSEDHKDYGNRILYMKPHFIVTPKAEN